MSIPFYNVLGNNGYVLAGKGRAKMFFTPSHNTPRSLASNFHSQYPKVDSEKEDKNQQVSLIADKFSALLIHTPQQ